MATKPNLLLIIILITLTWLQVAIAQLVNPSTPPMRIYSPKECRSAQSNCTEMVYPYLQNPQYMFPTSLDHVNDMCKMWSKFVDCIRRYISNCFEESRRVLFHKSVENSIDTVHAICSSKVYQNEYLTKATCFKQVSIDHCGTSYQQLIDVVSNPNAHDEHICCYYAQFKECVNLPLLQECGRKAKNLMDHSMSFLISRCQYYNQKENMQQCSKPPIFERKLKDIETTTTTVSNFDLIRNNKIDPSNQEPDAHAQFDSSYEDSQPRNTVPEGNNPEAHKYPSLTTTAPSTIGDHNPVDNSNKIDSIDSIEASESDGKQAEQLIVYTMRPESQIGLAGFDNGAMRVMGVDSIGHVIGHLVRLALFLGWIRWFQY